MQNADLEELTQLIETGSNLSDEQIQLCADLLTSITVEDSPKKEFLVAWSRKGETSKELSSLVSAFRNKAISPNLDDFQDRAIDLCGTGGDKAGSFNISTFVSFILAAGGVPVIKHGNRSISSKCGSADLLEAIGIPLQANSDILKSGLEELNFAFLFAPAFHPAFKHIASVRKSLAEDGIITIFNLLGPMLNPARPKNQLLGVFSERYLEKIGAALQENGTENGMIVHGRISNDNISGVDELTACGNNQVFGFGSLQTQGIESWKPSRWNQEEFDFQDLKGGSLDENLSIMQKVLSQDCPPGLWATIMINAATAFVLSGKSSNLEDGNEYARHLIESGKVSQWLERSREFFSKR